MGAEISCLNFARNDYAMFRERLLLETTFLKHLLLTGKIQDSSHSAGIELEAALINKNLAPHSINEKLISLVNHPQVVSELAKNNIEINGSPFPFNRDTFKLLSKDINALWKICDENAKILRSQLILIGTIPTAEKHYYNMDSMTPQNRYNALNSAIFDKHQSHQVHFSSHSDQLLFNTNHIMPASAATSMQFQWKVPASIFKDVFNAAQFLSPFSVALSANSPFLFGHQLWDESRVPLFEHSINSAPTSKGVRPTKRAFFGSGFLDCDFLEVYEENLNNYEVLLPVDFGVDKNQFHHLNLHNGTIWRWNRPVVGVQDDGVHIRLEHRVASAGPTITDGLATMAFFIGASYELATSSTPIQHRIPFALVESNFYRASKRSLDAELFWQGGTKKLARDIILDDLLEVSKMGLKKLGLNSEEVLYLLDSVLVPRVKRNLNGAKWQKDFVAAYGKDFSALTELYLENQQSGKPLHEWTLNS